MKAFTPRQQVLKDKFVETHGHWDSSWDGLLAMDPEFFDAVLELASVPRQVGPLEPKVRDFICIAVDASTTHLYEPGLRIHVRNAIGHGATGREILEVLELVSALGIHTFMVGMPLLNEELEKGGIPRKPIRLNADQQALKDAFTSNRGYWAPLWEEILDASPQFFKAYARYSSAPWISGTLPPKVKELIYIAIDAATTHLWEPGWRIHIRNALKHGATVQEIIQVYQLVSALGLHSLNVGVPVLVEELERAGLSLD